MPTQFLLKPDDFVMGSLLLHYDADIAAATSHALQALVLRNRDLRVPIIRQVLQLTLQYMSCQAPLYAPALGAEENNSFSLLNELLALLDLWALATFHEQLPTTQQKSTLPPASPDPSNANPAGPTPAQAQQPRISYWTPAQAAALLDEVEAVALVGLCDAIPYVRSTALAIIGAVEALREQFSLLDHNRGLTWLMKVHGTSIMQKVRYEYVLDAAQGMADQVTIVRHRSLTHSLTD